MKTILLQGDSITYFHRTTGELNKGSGYATIVAGEIMLDYPGRYNVINRGVGGDKIVDLYARMQRDILNHAPDYLSILIGVNDVWQNCGEKPSGVDDGKYREMYCMLVEELLAELPDLKIYIIEPYILPGPQANSSYGAQLSEVRKRAASARFVAEKYGQTFVPLQERFEELYKVCEPSYWFTDGVHPTPAGHAVIANALLEVLRKDLD